MFIGSFDFGQMLNQSGLPQNQVFGQPVQGGFGQPIQGGDALGNFMANLPQTDLSAPMGNATDFNALQGQASQGMGGNLMQDVSSQLTAEFLKNLFKPQEMPQVQPMSQPMSGTAPQLSNPYSGLLSPQPVSPMQSSGLLGAQPMQPMLGRNPMLGDY